MENLSLKELRVNKGLTQIECAKILNLPTRTYVRYENGENKNNSFKYKMIYESLNNYHPFDEEHGILSIDQIKAGVNKVLSKYDVEYCYLFGSYAKNKATELSDIDLFISVPSIKGLRFIGIIEELRNELCKKIDLIDFKELEGNNKIIDEILKDGIKIYG